MAEINDRSLTVRWGPDRRSLITGPLGKPTRQIVALQEERRERWRIEELGWDGPTELVHAQVKEL